MDSSGLYHAPHRISRFVAVDRDTVCLLPLSTDEWLAQDFQARLVIEVVDQLNSSELIWQYGGRGSDAQHLATLLGSLAYG